MKRAQFWIRYELSHVQSALVSAERLDALTEVGGQSKGVDFAAVDLSDNGITHAVHLVILDLVVVMKVLIRDDLL